MTTHAPPACIDNFTERYRFLSTYFPGAAFYLPRMSCEVPSGEHGYQALKSLDPDQRGWVVTAPTAGEAHRRGQQVTLRPDWEQVCRPLMMEVQLAKFSHPDLRQRLLATRDTPLINGNSWGDDYWGAVLDAPAIVDRVWAARYGTSLTGHNWLGRILMTTRKLMTPESP